MEETMKRDQLIVRTSIIGIVANLFLAAFRQRWACSPTPSR